MFVAGPCDAREVVRAIFIADKLKQPSPPGRFDPDRFLLDLQTLRSRPGENDGVKEYPYFMNKAINWVRGTVSLYHCLPWPGLGERAWLQPGSVSKVAEQFRA